MRYYDDMYLSLREATSLRTLIGVLWDDNMEGEKPHRRFYAQGYGANPSSGFKSILQGVWCMSKKGQAIVEGWNVFELTNDIATLWEVGDRFFRTHSTTREDWSKVHYHCNRDLTRWAEVQLVKDCTGATAAKFLFEYVLMRFGCPRILMSDHDTHFLNETISTLTGEFQEYHQKSTTYHL